MKIRISKQTRCPLVDKKQQKAKLNNPNFVSSETMAEKWGILEIQIRGVRKNFKI